MALLNIATGVILILPGMRYVRKGLDRLFGSHFIDRLQGMTKMNSRLFKLEPWNGSSGRP